MQASKTIIRNNGKKEKCYLAYCSSCLKSKGYVRKSRVAQLCAACGGKKVGSNNLGRIGPNKGKAFSEESCIKMSVAKKQLAIDGWVPWNKGKKENRPDVIAKMSAAKDGVIPYNKGGSMTMEQRIKLSCINRGIEISEFDDFTMSDSHHERGKMSEMGLQTQCFERDNFTCNLCYIRGVELHAHHLNGWRDYPEQRFDLANLVTLCNPCHKTFHAACGNGKVAPNTKEQYLSYMANLALLKKVVFILAGAPASGKSWVLSQVSNLTPLDNDKIPKKKLLNAVETAINPIVALTIGVSTFIKRNPHLDCKLIVIQESIDTLNQRMLLREGKITSTIERRHKRMLGLGKKAVFAGTAADVLAYIKQLDNQS